MVYGMKIQSLIRVSNEQITKYATMVREIPRMGNVDSVLLQVLQKSAQDGDKLALIIALRNHLDHGLNLRRVVLELTNHEAYPRSYLSVDFAQPLEGRTTVILPQVELMVPSGSDDVSVALMWKCSVQDVIFSGETDGLCLNKVRVLFEGNPNHPELLILGDSVMEMVSHDDQNLMCLRNMLIQDLSSRYKALAISHTAYHGGVYFAIASALDYFRSYPNILVLPINMRSFSPSWDFHPSYQCNHVIAEVERFLRCRGCSMGPLYDTDMGVSFDEFHRKNVLYPLTSISRIGDFERYRDMKPRNEDEEFARYRHLFIYFHLFELTEENRRLILLKKAAQKALSMKMKVLMYITPVNYQAGERFVGRDFIPLFLKNVTTATNYLSHEYRGDIVFHDFSRLFDSRFFNHMNDPTEHLNQEGRAHLSKLIAAAV